MDINLTMSIFLFRVSLSLSPEIKRSWIQTNEEERGGRERGGEGGRGNLKLSNFVPCFSLIRDAEVFT